MTHEEFLAQAKLLIALSDAMLGKPPDGTLLGYPIKLNHEDSPMPMPTLLPWSTHPSYVIHRPQEGESVPSQSEDDDPSGQV